MNGLSPDRIDKLRVGTMFQKELDVLGVVVEKGGMKWRVLTEIHGVWTGNILQYGGQQFIDD